MATLNWQPTASITTLHQRAQMLASIREFFRVRNVLEVETPLLANSGVTDLHLDNLESQFTGPGFAKATTFYLQTSPEYAMKRLLAAGSGCIYQICKAFRDDEVGKNHNPEFTMLEWYRVGFNLADLMAEMDLLLQQILGSQSAEYLTYQQAFIQYCQLDPLTCDINELNRWLITQGQQDIIELIDDKDTLLQFIFSQYIEPNIGQDTPCFIYQFPASQAALAKINQDDPRVAERFEVYCKGIELANGFYELTDAAEQLARFKHDNQLREQNNKPTKPIDMKLITALQHGLPDCAGVALGIDRLLMLAENKQQIADVISFDISAC